KDIAPQAPVHVLFIPKPDAIPTLDDARPEHAQLLGRLMLAAADYARREGLAQDGYRVVMNCREHAGQTVFHVHLHLLAGAPLGHFGACAGTQRRKTETPPIGPRPRSCGVEGAY